jgi:hypothetical protein
VPMKNVSAPENGDCFALLAMTFGKIIQIVDSHFPLSCIQ